MQQLVLTFQTGDTARTLTYAIDDDSAYDEVSCSLTVTVLEPAPVSYLVSSTAGSVTVQIADDEDPPQLQVSFAPDPPSVLEGDPIELTIAITNSVVFARETELAVQSSDLTAEAADDYQVPATHRVPGRAGVGRRHDHDRRGRGRRGGRDLRGHRRVPGRGGGAELRSVPGHDRERRPALGAAEPGGDAGPGLGDAELEHADQRRRHDQRLPVPAERRRGGTTGARTGPTITGSGPTTTGHTVTGLDSGTSYTFQVRARNGAGPGAESAQATASPTTSPPPAAPVNLRAAAETDQVTLSWTTPPDAGGSPIKRYEYRQSTDGGFTWNPDWSAVPDSGPTTTSHAVMGLEPGTPYTFGVHAVSDDGEGAAGDRVGDDAGRVARKRPHWRQRRPADGTRRPRRTWVRMPAPGRCGCRGPRRTRAASPATNTGTAAMEGRPGARTGPPSRTAGRTPPATPSRTWSPGTPYTFEVRALNADGSAGAAASVAAATTSGVPPAAPADLDADAGARQVRLSWTTPDHGGGITGYEYRHSSDGGQTWSPDWTAIENSGPDTTAYTVTGLEPGTGYTFEVRALNADGSGAAAHVSAATVAVPPGAPTDLRAAAAAGQVTLSWRTAGDDGGSAITGHQYRHAAAGGAFGAWTAIPDSAAGQANANRYMVSGLQDGTSYTFEVRALNAAGAGAAASVSVTLPPVATLPKAWLARLGRTVAAHAVDAVTARLYGTPATHVLIGGPRVQQPPAPAPTPASQTDDPAAEGPQPVPLPAPAPDGPAPAPAPTADAPAAAEPLAADAQVTLSWAAADDHGSTVTGYQYRRSSDGGITWLPDWTDITDSSALTTHYTVTGLDLGTTYTFELRALNAIGHGTVSTVSATTPALLPAAPRSLRADPAMSPVSPTALQADAAPALPDQPAHTPPDTPPEPEADRPVVAPAAVEQHHDSGYWTLWGHGAWSHFDGVEDALTLRGEVRTGIAGLDFQRSGVLGGLAVALSWADGTFDHAASGDSAAPSATLLAIHPYLSLTLHERLSVWGLFGYAAFGDLSLQRTGAESLYTGAGMTMGAFGVRGTLLPAPRAGGFELSTTADGMLVHIHSEAAAGLRASSADVQRVRLRLDASWSLMPLLGGVLTPALQVGGRYDGGDAETGAGLLVGGRLSYDLPAWGLSLTATGHGLLLHEQAGFRQWGAGGSVRLDPGARGRGLALRVAPSWGIPAAGDGLSSLPDASDWTDSAQGGPPARLDAELSYGLDAPGGSGLLTPYAGFALDSAGQRTWRFGSRLRLDPGFSLLLQGSRTDAALPHHSLTLAGSLRS